jgi:hypothetical protein
VIFAARTKSRSTGRNGHGMPSVAAKSESVTVLDEKRADHGLAIIGEQRTRDHGLYCAGSQVRLVDLEIAQPQLIRIRLIETMNSEPHNLLHICQSFIRAM